MTSILNDEEIRIAIIDDDEDDYFLISELIKEIDGKKFIIDWYKDYSAALEKVQSKSYHLYFVDYFLGNKTGLDLLQEAARLKIDRPIVLLTGFGSKDIDISAMRYGATDYLKKSELSTEKLERCIRYAIERAAFVEELVSRETKYRNLFEGSKDAVFIADLDLSFIEVNRSAIRLLNLPGGNLYAHTLYGFIEEETQKARIQHLVKNGGQIDDLEIKIKDHNKEIKNCLLSLYVQHNEDQDSLVHGIIHDITNIKKAELTNLQSEKLVANERVIRMLAHEIRNPLNNIILSVEQLKPEDPNEPQNDFLDIIQRNSLRINQIITDLLNLSTPSELVFEKYTLQEIIDESLARASDRILLHNINVKKNYPASPLLVSADKNKLVIAFTNILINAVEAMEIDKGILSIDMSELLDGYSVSIKDNGKGIPKEYLSRLFDPFFTLKKNGMGLGLTASYSIIQSHKGKMQIESNVDNGTNFVISFNKN